jgi:hypothetical protein
MTHLTRCLAVRHLQCTIKRSHAVRPVIINFEALPVDDPDEGFFGAGEAYVQEFYRFPNDLKAVYNKVCAANSAMQAAATAQAPLLATVTKVTGQSCASCADVCCDAAAAAAAHR